MPTHAWDGSRVVTKLQLLEVPKTLEVQKKTVQNQDFDIYIIKLMIPFINEDLHL